MQWQWRWWWSAATCMFLVLDSTLAMIPTVCSANVTLSKVCCPVPNGFHEPCGGKGRGYCRELQVYKDFPPPQQHLRVDDRLNWPTRFFTHTCHCEPNFYGVDCGECWFGMSGEECNERVYHTRRNIFSFTALEKKRFQEMIVRTRKVDSGFVVLREDSVKTSDPLSKEPTYLAASIHYYLVALHRYASRPVLLKDSEGCSAGGDDMDYNHNGPGFVTWHRMLMLIWERYLRKMAVEMFGWKSFAIPYWDWVDAEWCEVCTNDLMGSLGTEDRDGQRLHRESPFHMWEEFCTEPSDEEGINCYGCHFAEFGKLVRKFDTLRYPTSAELDFVLNRKVYFKPTEDTNTDVSKHCEGFTEALEGHCGPGGVDSNILYMHNRVHNMVDGSFCCASTAPNDPKFIAHHSQVDRLVQLWHMRHRPHETELPTQDSKPGHYADSNIVGFIPAVPHRMMFGDLKEFGILYDSYLFGKNNTEFFRPEPPKEWRIFMKEMKDRDEERERRHREKMDEKRKEERKEELARELSKNKSTKK